MDTVQIKVEPTEFIDVNNIKTEPLDTGPPFDPLYKIEPDYLKVEIKEEVEDDGIELDNNYSNSNEEDSCTTILSPTMSLPNSPDSTCRVEILEQPLKKIRFRYLSELQGTPHGPVLGERSLRNQRTYPKVRLVGYDGGRNETIKMRCWLVDRTNLPRGQERPHCHSLVVRRCNPKPGDIVHEPHEVIISRDNNYTAEFENMVILHSVQRNLEKQYMAKVDKWRNRISLPTCLMPDSSELPELTSVEKKKVREVIRSINKNEVYLYFEAFIEYRNSVSVLCSAISNPIRNLKNPISGDLKICKVFNRHGTSSGDTEVCLFVEKVPQDIKVKMFNETWVEFITPENIHRNFALSFRTPRFPFDINDDTKVQFCLFRESDGCESNPQEFTYRPSGKKRKYSEMLSPSSSSQDDGSLLGSSEIQDEVKFDFDNQNFICDYEVDIKDIDFVLDPTKLLDESMDGHINSTDWSGSSLEAALGTGQLFRNSSLEADGLNTSITFGSTLMNTPMGALHKLDETQDSTSEEFQNPLKEAVKQELTPASTVNSTRNISIQQNAEKKIVNNILLTLKYKEHLNCLQHAILTSNGKLLTKILSVIQSCARDAKKPHLIDAIKKIRNEQFQTVLHMAVLYMKPDSIDILHKLLAFGYDPMSRDGDGNTAYHLAAMKSSSCALKALINHSKINNSDNLTASNFEGFNILHLAARGNNDEVVKYILLQKLVDVNSKDTNSGETALHIASRCLHYKIAKLLIDNGADKEVVNLLNYSPLQLSVLRNDHKMAALLIAKGSDPLQECLSLTTEQYEPIYGEEELEEESDETSDTVYCNSFSLALDFEMHDILLGKFNNLKINDTSDEIEETSPKIKGPLLSSDEVLKLSEMLAQNGNLELLLRELDIPHLRATLSSTMFGKPEKILVNFIINDKDKIFGECNQRVKLKGMLSRIGLKTEEIFNDNIINE